MIILFILAFNLVKSLSTIGFKLVTIETSVGIAHGQRKRLYNKNKALFLKVDFSTPPPSFKFTPHVMI